jgi:maltose O-acetyltransferase
METERAKMLRGDLYDAREPELTQARLRARQLLAVLNQSGPDAQAQRSEILHALFGSMEVGAWIEPPFFCDYGSNIHLGEQVFINFSCVILDPAEVRIGDSALLGLNVQIYTATHPLDHRMRSRGLESALPARIGAEAWLGGSPSFCRVREWVRVR